MEPLLTAQEAAAALRMHPETLYKVVKAGKIAVVRRSDKKKARLFFREVALKEYLDRQEQI
jgi:excisionase family DNA binding protein